MRAGTLRERITLQSFVSTQNEIGEVTEAWVDFAALVPASVLDISGKEFIASAATQNTVLTKIVIREMTGVLASMQITHGADTYAIKSIIRQRDKSLLLMCVRGA